MEYTRTALSHSPFKTTREITVVWGNDGWRYVPQLKFRDKFTEKLYTREEWDGVLALPESIEVVNWGVHLKEPLTWSEGGELFSVKQSTRGSRMNTQPRREHGQPPRRP